MNRAQRRLQNKRIGKMKLINFAIEGNFNGEWSDHLSEKPLSDKKFKKLLKEYKFDMHKFLVHKDNQMKKHNLSWKDHWVDIELFKVISYFMEMQKFRNKISLEQVFQILEMFISKLDPINSRVFLMHIIVGFDFLLPELLEKLDKIKSAVLDAKDYEEDEYYEREELYFAILKSEHLVNAIPMNWIARMKIHKEQIKKIVNAPKVSHFEEEDDFNAYYDDKDYVEVYRGFIVSNEDRVRKLDSIKMFPSNDSAVEQMSDDCKSFFKHSQHAGRGTSYTFDKKTALCFAFRTMNHFRRFAVKENDFRAMRACVAKYRVRKDDIFAYSDYRYEREVLVKSNDEIEAPVSLMHYEFFSNGEGDFSNTGMLFEPKFRKSAVEQKEDYAKLYKNTKIERVFN
jgi:hypothetical protein